MYIIYKDNRHHLISLIGPFKSYEGAAMFDAAANHLWGKSLEPLAVVPSTSPPAIWDKARSLLIEHPDCELQDTVTDPADWTLRLNRVNQTKTLMVGLMKDHLPNGVKDFDAVLVSGDVGGIYAYIFDVTVAGEFVAKLNAADDMSAHDIMQELNCHSFMGYDSEDHARNLMNSIIKNEMDVLLLKGEPVGLAIRDNPATIRLLHVINGDPVDALPKGWGYTREEDRVKQIGRTVFGTLRNELLPSPVP